ASALRADDSRSGKDDAGALVMQAIAAPQNMAKVETAMREELAKLIKDGITETELQDAVSGILTEREQSRADDSGVADLLVSQLTYARDMQFTAALDAKFKALTLEQVNAAIRKNFKPEDLSVYLAGDFAKASSPAAPAGK
ncbi:MAG: insulinase family protein, partial [Pseudoxanthomonas sp.]